MGAKNPRKKRSIDIEGGGGVRPPNPPPHVDPPLVILYEWILGAYGGVCEPGHVRPGLPEPGNVRPGSSKTLL